MKKYFKIIVLALFVTLSFSSCKSANNVNSKDINILDLKNNTFLSNDNGRIYIGLENGVDNIIDIKFPDYCWNKESGIIVDKNGNVFKKLDKDNATVYSVNPKIEIKNGKKYLNSNSEFYPNDRFELKDEFTIVDNLLGIEYVNYRDKYNIDEFDENDYPNRYKESVEIKKEYETLAKDLETYKHQLSKESQKAIEREMELNKNE